MTFAVSVFQNLTDQEAAATLSWEDFVELLKSPEFPDLTTNKKDVPSFGMFSLVEKGSRKKDNIGAMLGVALDVDKHTSPERVRALIDQLTAMKLKCLIYSTYSTDESGARLRVVVPLAEPLSVQEYEQQKLAHRLAHTLRIEVDDCSSRPTQVYFLPACPPDYEHLYFIEVMDGAALTPDMLPALPVKRSKVRAQSQSDSEDEDDEVAVLAKKIVAAIEDGVPPIETKAGFHVYGMGVWNRCGYDEFRTWVFNEVCEQKVTVSKVTAAVSWLQLAHHKTKMPAARYDSLTNIGGVTIDLRTHEVVANSPDNFIAHLIPHEYDPEATCPRFEQFLNEIFAGDSEAELKLLHLQEWFGYLLMPTTKLQKMLFLYGSGANGKSVLTALLTAMLGEDNVSAVPLGDLGVRFATSDLNGMLANIVDETGVDAGVPDGKLKDLIGGGRTRAEYKGKDAFMFYAFVRMVASTNYLPNTRDSGHGFFRRLLVLALLRRFEPHEQDPNLLEALKAEMPGILQFAIKGAVRLITQDGFTEVPSSATILEEYANEANSVKRFMEQALEAPGRCEPETGKPFKTRCQLIFRAYVRFCTETNSRPMGDVKFGKMIKELGVERIKSNGATYYNVQLRDRWQWLSDNDELERELKRVEGSLPPTPNRQRFLANVSDEFGS